MENDKECMKIILVPNAIMVVLKIIENKKINECPETHLNFKTLPRSGAGEQSRSIELP